MDKEKIINLTDQNAEKIQNLIQEKIKIWSEFVVFSNLWWFAFALSVVPWILWILFRKKQSTDRLFHGGLFVMVISLILDVLGDQFGFWHYRFNLIPVLPTYFPWDLSLMPVAVMSLIQIKPNSSPFVKAVVFAILTSYVGEPIFQWIGVYVPKNWRYTYSVPIQIIIYLLTHYLTRRDKYTKLD